jgi:hypothetical protein
MRTLALSTLVAIACFSWAESQPPPTEADALKLVEKLGGKVEVDAKHPDRPIIAVDL